MLVCLKQPLAGCIFPHLWDTEHPEARLLPSCPTEVHISVLWISTWKPVTLFEQQQRQYWTAGLIKCSKMNYRTAERSSPSKQHMLKTLKTTNFEVLLWSHSSNLKRTLFSSSTSLKIFTALASLKTNFCRQIHYLIYFGFLNKYSEI